MFGHLLRQSRTKEIQMLISITPDNDGSISALQFHAETPEDREKLLAEVERFKGMDEESVPSVPPDAPPVVPPDVPPVDAPYTAPVVEPTAEVTYPEPTENQQEQG